jgi:hypothetical protein
MPAAGSAAVYRLPRSRMASEPSPSFTPTSSAHSGGSCAGTDAGLWRRKTSSVSSPAVTSWLEQ